MAEWIRLNVWISEDNDGPDYEALGIKGLENEGKFSPMWVHMPPITFYANSGDKSGKETQLDYGSTAFTAKCTEDELLELIARPERFIQFLQD